MAVPVLHLKSPHHAPDYSPSSISTSAAFVIVFFTILGFPFYVGIVVAGTYEYEYPFQTTASEGLWHLKDSATTRRSSKSASPINIIFLVYTARRNAPFFSCPTVPMISSDARCPGSFCCPAFATRVGRPDTGSSSYFSGSTEQLQSGDWSKGFEGSGTSSQSSPQISFTGHTYLSMVQGYECLYGT